MLAVFTLPGVILALFPDLLADAEITRRLLTGMSLAAGVLAALCLLVYGIRAPAAPPAPGSASAAPAAPAPVPADARPSPWAPPAASSSGPAAVPPPAPPPAVPPFVPAVAAATAPAVDPHATKPMPALPVSPTGVWSAPPAAALGEAAMPGLPAPGGAPAGAAAATRSVGVPATQTVVLRPDAPVHMAWLVYLDGPRAGDAIRVDPDTVIGREPQAQGGGIVLVDAAVSSVHARLIQDADSGRFVIHDLGSTNGTLVNGLRVNRQPLADKDRLRLGRTELAFIEVRFDPAASAGRS
jgi:hypothetical protein